VDPSIVKLAVTFPSMKMGEGISGGCLSEAEERTVLVLTPEEAKIADGAITVSYYLDTNGEERDGELHGRS
jgi:hypothetical protein